MNRTGLCNLGNTCYLNTVVQCLRHCPDFARFMRTSSAPSADKPQSKVFTELRRTFKALNARNAKEQQTPYSPTLFVKSVLQYAATKKDSQFVDFRQNDAHEFLIFLIECLHDGIKKSVTIKINGVVKNERDKHIKDGMVSFSKFYKNEYSKLIHQFFGQYQSCVHYTEKNELSYTYEPFMCLQLEIPPRLRRPTIYDCLIHFTSTEKLNDSTYKGICLWNTPQYLVCCLKRFVPRGKNIAPVHIPLTLNLREFTNGPNKYDQSVYELIAVCNHSGRRSGGHYYAFCRDAQKKWWVYNDASVREISAQSVSTPNAYCVFYSKISKAS